jgi:putative acetyltransferase
MTLEIERAGTATEEIRILIAELEEELSPNYEPHQRHGLALEAIFRPDIHFFVARRAGQALGCAGVALMPDFAEVKRMYVRAEVRGKGIAEALMDRLARTAQEAGLHRLKLETGDRQQAAIRFYARCGFEICGAFEPYAAMPPENIATSVFMAKTLV